MSYQQLNYVVEKDTTFIRLDSALRIIDTMMCDCRKYYAGLVSTKLQILSVKQEYIQALNFIRDLDEKEIYPLNKLILLKRFEAIQAQSEGDIMKKNRLISEIVHHLKDNVLKDTTKINSILQIPDELEIMQHIESHDIIRLYYYRTQTEGVDKIQNELDSLQKAINGNQIFFEMIKTMIAQNSWFNTSHEFYPEEDFMYFTGL